MSRDQLAVAVGVSSKTIARAERGESPLSGTVIAAIAVALEVSVGSLFDEDGVAA